MTLQPFDALFGDTPGGKPDRHGRAARPRVAGDARRRPRPRALGRAPGDRRGDVELVAEAATAEDAFALALSVRPDVLLLDIDLPGMNGIQMLEELAPRLPETKIVMLTVSDSERDMLEAIARGAAGYLTKDLSPEALLRALRGTQRGELAMSRRFAARAIRHFVEAARRAGGGSGVIEGLSPRENDVLRMLAEGLTDREIAAALVISPRTVETHVSNVLHKLNVRNRAEAAQRYRDAL